MGRSRAAGAVLLTSDVPLSLWIDRMGAVVALGLRCGAELLSRGTSWRREAAIQSLVMVNGVTVGEVTRVETDGTKVTFSVNGADRSARRGASRRWPHG